MTPANATAAKKYTKPFEIISAIKTITVAPAPPEIIPGLPPKIAVNKHKINEAYKPIKRGKQANITNDSDSGVIATVKPARISVLKLTFCKKSNKLNTFFI